MPETLAETVAQSLPAAVSMVLGAGVLALVAIGAPAARAAVPERSKQPLALIAGGGSGGHVFPGLAVAEELIGQGWRIAMVGAANGLESRLALARGHDFYALPALPVLGQGILGKTRSILTLARSTARAVSLVRELDPRLVIGTGGYLSAPAALGGALARRPLLLIEPNAEAGLANRWLSRLAAGACTAHAETAARLRCETWTTGVPVRAEFLSQPALDDVVGEPRLLVLGGSQGALALNRALPGVLIRAFGDGGGSILHQAGRSHREQTVAAYRRLLPQHSVREVGDVVRLEPPATVHPEPAQPAEGEASAPSRVLVEVAAFIEDMARAMGACHLVLSRAGAVTLAEICAAGRGSILIPLPIAAGHQKANAKALEELGAAILVNQDQIASLTDRLGPLLADRARLGQMARQARRLARGDAAREIARHGIALASGRIGEAVR